MEIEIKKILKEEHSDPNICMISKKAFDSLGLSEETLYEIHLGQQSWISFLKRADSGGKVMYIHADRFDRLIPFEKVVLNIWVVNKDIRLGPVLGIFETPKTIETIASGGAELYEVQHMQASAAENCLGYYFSPEDIDWEEERIKGITLSMETGQWISGWFPMPDVVYDEGVFLTDKLKKAARKVRREFRSNPNIQFINSRNGLNKWELCQRLSKYPAVGKYIPKTQVYTGFHDIDPMLEKYGIVFLKSFHGSKGQEVLSIERQEEHYTVHLYDYSEQELKKFSLNGREELEALIDTFFEDNDLILQQGIQLQKYSGSSFDIRVMLQKFEKGVWECPYVTCRIAKGSSRITNVSAGGRIAVFERIYPELVKQYGEELIPTKDEIEAAAIKIATYIEKEFGLFGELGLDIGVDKFRKIWLIEANAKPDKGISTDHVDFNGVPVIDIPLEDITKTEAGCPKGVGHSAAILPQALATFRYAKFLVKCR